jgi:hypothetical protein
VYEREREEQSLENLHGKLEGKRRMASFGMLHRVALVRTIVPEERSASHHQGDKNR